MAKMPWRLLSPPCSKKHSLECLIKPLKQAIHPVKEISGTKTLAGDVFIVTLCVSGVCGGVTSDLQLLGTTDLLLPGSSP